MPEYRILEDSMHSRIFASRKKIKIIGGGFGNGKTTAAVIQGLQLAKAYPGSNGLVAMATYKQLTDTIQKAFVDWTPASSIDKYPTLADPTMKLKNGSRINFRYIKQKGKAAAADGQTTSNLLSATYDWAIVDQLENPEITHKDFLDLLGRMRGSTPYVGTDDTMPRTGPRWIILCVNPSFNWVYHKLIKPYHIFKQTGEITKDLIVSKNGEPLIEVFEGSTYENAHNLEPDFIETMEAAYKGQFRKRYLGGEYGAFEGLIYPEFDKAFHVLSKDRIMRYLINLNHQQLKPDSLEGFDFGIAAPSCYLFGFTDPMGRIFIVEGFHKAEMDLTTIGTKITNIRLEFSGLVDIDKPIYADPAIFKRSVIDRVGKRADTIKSILTNDFDLDFVAGQNPILSGIAKVNSYINIRNFPHFENENEHNGGVFYIASHLMPVIEEFGSYFWKTQNNERIDEPIDVNDHGMDTIKYMLSYLPDVKALFYNVRTQKWRL
jgi:hypothetical protein